MKGLFLFLEEAKGGEVEERTKKCLPSQLGWRVPEGTPCASKSLPEDS